MKILFYQNPPSIQSTLLTWTLAEELRLLGHQVDYYKPQFSVDDVKYDWVHGAGTDAPDALFYARQIGAKCHIHLEGVAYWRIGYENAIDWGYHRNHSELEIESYTDLYKSWMKAAYEADSCTVNGPKQVKAIEWMFGGKKLPNCHLIHCGVDARYALALPSYKKEDYMVTVSRLEPNKKVFWIAEALALLQKNGFQVPPWVVLGYGTSDQTERLINFCGKNGITLILNPCFGAEKWFWIKRSRLMLAGWSGIPPEEAVVCSVPCLTFDDQDIRNAFRNTLYYANSIEEYASKIEWLLDDGNLQFIFDKTEFSLECLLGLQYPDSDGLLFANTQERAAKNYEQIFKQKIEPYQK